MGGDNNKDIIRGGNRGGKDQFKWDDVRLMTYKDREQYLGISEEIGILDKGGKWKKHDWWKRDRGDDSEDAYELMLEKKFIKAQEEAIMRRNLGMPPKPGDKEILEAKDNGNELEKYEMKELLRKGGRDDEQEEDIIGDADKIGGVGFSQYSSAYHNPTKTDASLTKLEGVGIEDYKRMIKMSKKEKKKTNSERSSGRDKHSKKHRKRRRREENE
ncbi:unnamed protein product [Moneuplotes crassus]|uniref:Multiple myeloma tumor-associated protein 2-like N-terminal domain-containing protein n=1 Tax=Euplotes crassus TaxID=5936 RepID=A0AAD1XVC4_EUPCR|nr:unnamed protein product [Moneuplotes crassus]